MHMNEVMDFFEQSGPSIPVPSWDALGKGGVQGGVVLWQRNAAGVDVAYVTEQQTTMPTPDKPSEPLWFDDEKTKPRTQLVLLVQTDVRDFADCSDSFNARRKKIEEDGGEPMVDDGIRRMIVRGKDPSRDLISAIRKLGKQRVEAGMTVRQKLVGKKVLASNFKQNVIEVTVLAATPETLAVAEAHRSANAPVVEEPDFDF
jgi:hypothetical protein